MKSKEKRHRSKMTQVKFRHFILCLDVAKRTLDLIFKKHFVLFSLGSYPFFILSLSLVS